MEYLIRSLYDIAIYYIGCFYFILKVSVILQNIYLSVIYTCRATASLKEIKY